MDFGWMTNGLVMLLLPLLGLALAPGDGGNPGEGGDGGDGGAGDDAGRTDGQDPGANTQTDPPGEQVGGFKVTLTDAQRTRLLEGGELELTGDQYTAGVRTQMSTLRRKATEAEQRAQTLENEKKEAERKQLEEQKRFQELYEKEKSERTAEREQAETRQRDLALRSSFTTAAAKAGIVDPEAAYAIAKTLPSFAEVKVSEDGAVSGMAELVKALAEDKPYLVSTKSRSVGSATNPNQGTTPQPPAETQAEADARVRQRVRESGA